MVNIHIDIDILYLRLQTSWKNPASETSTAWAHSTRGQAAKLQDMEASKNAMEQLCSKLRDQLDQAGWELRTLGIKPERGYKVKLYHCW